MITQEETGAILARLAIADETFLTGMLQAAERAGDAMLPGDLEKLRVWAPFIRALRMVLRPDAAKRGDT